jgi:exodeoxyribonuclease-3
MDLISWNVNGIRSAAAKGFSDWLAASAPDIVCLQETKAHREQLPENLAEPPGYHSFWNSASRRGYSGVAVFSKEKPLSVKYGLGIEKFDTEGRVIELEYEWFTLLNIYFPNGQRDHGRVPFKLEFCDAVFDRCNLLRENGRYIVICGDFNTAHRQIDLKYPRANQNTTGFLPEERAWMDRFIAGGYTDTFREFEKGGGNYSWWTYRLSARERNIGWRIDYFFISSDLRPQLETAFILSDVHGSDHCPVGITIKSGEEGK